MYTEFRLMSLNELGAAKGNARRVDRPSARLHALHRVSLFSGDTGPTQSSSV